MGNIDISLHHAQGQIFTSKANVILLVSGRGFGKSLLILISSICDCLSFPGKVDPKFPLQVMIISPTLKMSKKNFWNPLLSLLEKSPYVKRIDKSNLVIYFKGDKPTLVIESAEGNGDRIRGSNLYSVYCDEFQDFGAEVFDSIITPCFRRQDTPLRALLAGTPKGRSSWMFKTYQRAISTPGWAYFNFPSWARPDYPKDTLELARATLPSRIFAQEYGAEWTSAPGQFFDCMEDRHLIKELPSTYDYIYLGLDHGSLNPAIAVIGVKDKVHYILDRWINPSKSMSVTVDQLVKEVAAMSEKYQPLTPITISIVSPDDRPDIPHSLWNLGHQLKIKSLQKAVTIPRSKPSPVARAEMVNSLFFQDRLFINDQLEDLIDDFKSYHRTKNKNTGEFLDEIAPGQSDHLVDACEYILGHLNKNSII